MQGVLTERFSYLQKGTGRDLLFLHGYLCTKETFAVQTEYFARFYRVTALDFPGFGGTPLPSAYAVEDYAQWTAEAMRALNIKNPVILAHSFGARVAIKGLATGLFSCEKLVLTGAAGVVRHGVRYRAKVGLYRMVKAVAPQFAKRRFGSSEYRSLSPLLQESYKKIVNEDLRQAASLLTCPTLLLYGKEDKTTPKRVAKILWRSIQGSRLVWLDGGHFAFIDDALRFRLLTEEFIR